MTSCAGAFASWLVLMVRVVSDLVNLFAYRSGKLNDSRPRVSCGDMDSESVEGGRGRKGL